MGMIQLPQLELVSQLASQLTGSWQLIQRLGPDVPPTLYRTEGQTWRSGDADFHNIMYCYWWTFPARQAGRYLDSQLQIYSWLDSYVGSQLDNLIGRQLGIGLNLQTLSWIVDHRQSGIESISRRESGSWMKAIVRPYHGSWVELWTDRRCMGRPYNGRSILESQHYRCNGSLTWFFNSRHSVPVMDSYLD